MTKETKIGLLVGMGVIILIGILVSDHLSDAQRQQGADLTRTAMNHEPTPIPADLVVRPPSAEPPPPLRRTEPVPLPHELTGNGAAVAPNFNDNRPVETRLDVYDLTRSSRQPADTIGPGAGADGSFVSELTTDDRRPAQPETTVDRRSATEAAQPDSGRAAPAAGDFIVHFVEEKQTLSDIARKYYGDSNEWKTIFEANRSAIPRADLVRPGVRLMIPKRSSAAAPAPAAKPSAAPAAPPAPKPDTPVKPAKPQYATYVVKPGDALSKIADRFYDKKGAWRDLYALNKDVIKDPDNLTVGTEIRVPGKQ